MAVRLHVLLLWTIILSSNAPLLGAGVKGT
jgi:hypothetical protein